MVPKYVEGLVAVAATIGVVLAPNAVTAAGCAARFQDAGAGVCTATFLYTGAPESITLPASVTAITAVVSAAEGGSSLEEQVDPFGGAASLGGKGGRESATIPVTPGASLSVVVGQAGTGGLLAPPGFGGYGGGGHASSRYGGNGGGGSFVFDANSVLIAAGGGGGGGYDYSPVVMGRGDQHAPGGDGSGASTASNGQSVPFCCDGTAPYNAGGGGGATPTSPGLGGHPSLPPSYVFGQADGDPGSGPAVDPNNFGNGGDTHNGCCYFSGWAGGGGGGYYGGGGGGNIEAQLEGGGGGGGAGCVTPAAVKSTALIGVQIGDGEVTISYYTGACNVSCTTCSGPASTDCTSCVNGSVLANGACVPATPTASVTRTDTATATGTSTPTSTPTPNTRVAIDLGLGVGRPGGFACIPVSLTAAGVPVAGTSNDFTYDPSRFSVASCSINPGIGPGTSADKVLSHIPLLTGTDRTMILGSNANLIPNGLLYTGKFPIAPGVAAGDYVLSNVATATDVTGGAISGVAAAAGHIIVTTCTGDCNGSGTVSIGEVIRCVNLFLGQPFCDMATPSLSCPVADATLDGSVSIGEVIQCVNRFLAGCV